MGPELFRPRLAEAGGGHGLSGESDVAERRGRFAAMKRELGMTKEWQMHWQSGPPARSPVLMQWLADLVSQFMY
jgi:hypothetical protein